MKRRISQILVFVFTVFSAMASVSPASADHYQDINRLARRIESSASAIDRVTGRNFRHSPYYRDLVNDTQQLRRLANHIRDVARVGCDLPHLQADVISLGNAYRRLEAKFCFVERVAPTCQNTRRVRRLLNDIQADIRQMLICLNQLLTPACPQGLLQPMMPASPHWGATHSHGGQTQNSMLPSGYGFELGFYNSTYYRGTPQTGLQYNAINNRHPTVNQLQNQSLQRSAELDRQLRDRRLNIENQPRSITIGGGSSRLAFNF